MVQPPSEIQYWSDYFHGGVPPGAIFRIELDKIEELINDNDSESHSHYGLPGLCLIGIVAHFEALFKHIFGAVGNICPATLEQFASERQEVKLDLGQLLQIREEVYHQQIGHQLGFLVAEQYSFASPKKINGLFRDLIGITPFSKKEKSEYERILAERNLLVHNGGVLTGQSVSQGMVRHAKNERSFFDSVSIEEDHLLQDLAFVDDVASKTVRASHQALNDFIDSEGIATTALQNKTVKFLAEYRIGN